MARRPGRVDPNRQLDWQRAEVGRIRRRPEAGSERERAATLALLDSLYDAGQFDLLTAIRDRRLSFKRLRAMSRSGVLDMRRPDLVQELHLERRLLALVREQLPRMGRTARTQRRYETSFNALERSGVLPPDLRVRDAASGPLWQRAMEQWPNPSAADWNHMRRLLSHALTLAFGDLYHPVRRRILKAIPRRRETPREAHMTAAEVWALVTAAHPAVAPAIATLCITGLRLGEFYALTPACLTAATGQVRVPTGKTGSRVVYVAPELWPWVAAAVPAPRQQKAFRNQFHRAAAAIGRPELRLHDLRHVNGHLVLSGGAHVGSLQSHLGHTTPHQSLDYVRGQAGQAAAVAVAQSLRRTG